MTRCAIAMSARMAALHFSYVPARDRPMGNPAAAQRPIRPVGGAAMMVSILHERSDVADCLLLVRCGHEL